MPYITLFKVQDQYIFLALNSDRTIIGSDTPEVSVDYWNRHPMPMDVSPSITYVDGFEDLEERIIGLQQDGRSVFADGTIVGTTIHGITCALCSGNGAWGAWDAGQRVEFKELPF